MNFKDFLNESVSKKFYHGSCKELPIGTILQPSSNYEQNWGDTDFYYPLEKNRPDNMLSHKNSVFMCDNIDDIDNAGGCMDYVYEVQPLGQVQRHDLNWGSEISMLSEDPINNSEKIKEAAEHYWNGDPHYNEQVWEYLTPRAKIISLVEEN